MSTKPFEEFLVDQFLEWASTNVKAGYRYQFKSPDGKNSCRLHDALNDASKGNTLVVGAVTLPFIDADEVKIIPLLHHSSDQGFSENYISHLRDEVAAQEGDLEGCSLLVVHNSLLDTLVNSSDDLSQKDHVWSPESIKRALGLLIDDQDDGCDVSRCLLDYRFDSIQEDGASMFGFEPLYNAISDGILEFSELDLLYDPLIENFAGKPQQIRNRLEENRELYRRLEYVFEHYPNDPASHLRDFGSSFFEKNIPKGDVERWKKIEFQEYRTEIESNKKQTLELENESSTNCKLVARDRSETAAGRRERHLIILIDSDQSEFEFSISFIGNDLENKQLKLRSTSRLPDNAEFKVSARGSKRSKATFRSSFDGAPMFFTLATKRSRSSEKYTFHCLALRRGDFFVDGFKTCFLLNPSKEKITLQIEENTLRVHESLTACLELDDLHQNVDTEKIGVVDFTKLANEGSQIEFSILSFAHSLRFTIEGPVASDTLSLPLLLDKDRFVRLLEDQYFGEFNRHKGKVVIDNKEVTPVSTRLNLLRWEAEFLDKEILAKTKNGVTTLGALSSIDESLFQSYKQLYAYLQDHKTLPSLVSWGENFTEIVKGLVASYIAFINAIKVNTTLSVEQKSVLNLGFGCFDDREYITPYHPIVLSYYLALVESIKKDGEARSFSSLPKVTIERLSPRGLLPYIYDSKNNFSYVQNIKENAFWLEIVPQEESSYKFVRKLVQEKIREFQVAFRQLFESNSNSKLIINAVNQLEANELFLGVVDYFKDKQDHSCQVHVNLYDDNLKFNAFDRFAEAANHVEIKSSLELDKGKSKDNADTIIDLIRSRLTFSKFTHQDSNGAHAYAHLAFFRNNQKVDCCQISIDAAVSGVACDGLLSGEASESKEGSYYTAFGLNKINYPEQQHLQLAQLYGSLLRPAREPNTQYTGANAVALAVNEGFKDLLVQAYDAAIWTTIIDPKVTLEFFTNNQDILLIHYSDQYTSSASYDAITVTHHTNLFKRVLEQGQGGFINEFNAFNGEWLLKMLTARGTERKGVEGIIGAYKFITGLVDQSDIIWVPLSVGEMIRVSGNIGLNMSESDFSRYVHGYRSGEISDDVLLVGFNNQNLFLLPVEVKTGAKPDYKKAIKQVRALKKYLIDLLGPRALANKMYRSLFVRQILIQVDKYRLYDVFEESYFDTLLDERERWLQGNYELAGIDNYPEGFVVAHVENDTVFEPSYTEDSSVLKIELPFSLLSRLIKTPLQTLLEEVRVQEICHVPDDYILKGDIKASLNPLFNEEDEDDNGNEGCVLEKGPSEAQQDSHPEACQTIEECAELDSSIKEEQKSDDAVCDVQAVVGKINGPLRVLFGHKTLNKEPVFWEPTNTSKVFNTNTGIIGTMGTGKTQFTKSLITQLIHNQKDNVGGEPIGVLIFDYKGDYIKEDFVQATNAKVYNLYNLPFNPFALVGDKPMLPVHTASQFRATLSKAFGLGAKQEQRIHGLVMEAYSNAGILPHDPGTWEALPPTLQSVWDLYNSQDKVEQDSLYAALYDLETFRIFEANPENTKSLYDVLEGVVVVNLSGYDSKVQNLVVAITLDIFYAQMHQQGSSKIEGDYRQISKMILVDEADNFMSQDFEGLKKILKEGREFGVGSILSTQELTHFKTGEADYSSYILTWIVHRVSQLKNQEIRSIFNLKDKKSEEELMQQVRKLDKHFSLYVDGEKNITKLKDKAFWELIS